MSPEIAAEMFAPPPATATPTRQEPHCERIVVVTADGRRFDLGRPDSRLFPLRRRLYVWKRRHEIKEAQRG